MKLVIADADGRREELRLNGESWTIGRKGDNQVRLAEKDVSRRHARLFRTAEGRMAVEDLRSLTGVRVNGERIDGPRELAEGDLIRISAYELALEDAAADARGAPIRPGDPPTAAAPRRPSPPGPRARRAPPPAARAAPSPSAAAGPAPLRSAEKPRLVSLSESLPHRAWLVERTQVSLGRAKASDIRLDHPSVADKHCSLRRVDGGWTVTADTGTTSLRVNGAAPSGPLLGGDVLELGEVQLVFLAPGQPFALPPSAAEGALPQRMAPVRVAEPADALPRHRLRLAACVLAAMAAAAALGASAGRLLRRRPARADPASAASARGHTDSR